MSHTRLVLIAGFAMFSMFFGSGNLVFPLMVGMKSLDQFHTASTGLILSAVVLPFAGLIAMTYYAGNRNLFFKSLGAPSAFILTFAMLSLMGPFGVLPRCIIVAHGGLDLVIDGLSAPLFNAIFSGLTGFLAWQRTKIIDIIGTFLTPFLLVGIMGLIVVGIFSSHTPDTSSLSHVKAFYVGLDEGYQTMDLLAAFFFSATTISYIAGQLHKKEKKDHLEGLSLTACCIGAFLLIVVYLGFVYLGAAYAPSLANVDPEKLLVVIAEASLGKFAIPIAASIIGLACLTTSTILASLFADFLHNDIMQKKIPRSLALIITLLIGYTFSLLGFTDLAGWIANALTIAYPALIAYAGFKILEAKASIRKAREAFWLVLLASILIRGFMAAGVISS